MCTSRHIIYLVHSSILSQPCALAISSSEVKLDTMCSDNLPMWLIATLGIK